MSSRRVWETGEGGRHVVVVASREELAAPSSVSLPPPAPAPGLIKEDGSINWGCPCLGGMATGPCGQQFRDAFSCFHYSEAEPKGSDCYEKFSVMQDCMSNYPELYAKDDDDDELAAAMEESAESRGDKGEKETEGGGNKAAGDAPSSDKAAASSDRNAANTDQTAANADH